MEKMNEILTARSQNSEWGVSVYAPEGIESITKIPVAGILVKKGAVAGREVYQLEPSKEDGSFAFAVYSECKAIINCSEILVMGLQGNGDISILHLKEGAVWKEFGYKARTSRYFKFVGGKIVTPSDLEILQIAEAKKAASVENPQELVNLTPHGVKLILADGGAIEIPPAGDPARVGTETQPAGTVSCVPIVRTTFGEVKNLPAPKAGILYIVSQIVKSACPQRADLVVPSEVVRDDKGTIIGCKALSF